MTSRWLLWILVAGTVSSCATMFHGRDTAVVVVSPEPSVFVLEGDTITREHSRDLFGRQAARIRRNVEKNACWRARMPELIGQGRAAVCLMPRSAEALSGVAVTDGGCLPFRAVPAVSRICVANLFVWPLAWIDLLGPKRYYYPEVLAGGAGALQESPAERKRRRGERFDSFRRRGELQVTLGFPWTNFFSSVPDALAKRMGQPGKRVEYGGFLGISAGIAYHYADRRSVAFEASAIADMITPFPAAVDFSGGHRTSCYGLNTSLTDNYHWPRFSVGYGVNIVHRAWRYSYDEDAMGEDDREPAAAPYGTDGLSDRCWAAGLRFDAYWKCAPEVSFGVAYRPSFYRFGSLWPWKYEHSISIDLKFHIRTGARIRSPRPDRACLPEVAAEK